MIEDYASWTLRDGTLLLRDSYESFDPLEFPKSLRPKIKKLVGSKGLKEIVNPFTVFENIEEVDLSKSDKLETIIESCFAKLFNLKVVELPISLKVIEKRAFEGSFLEKLSVTTVNLRVGFGCFQGSKIQEIKFYSADSLTFDEGVFQNALLLRKVSIEADFLTMSHSCFLGCENLREVNFDCCLKAISTETFKDCENLKRIELPNDLRWVGMKVFSNCKALEYIKFPDSLERITESSAFNDVNEDVIIEFMGVVWPLSLFKRLVEGHVYEDRGDTEEIAEVREFIKMMFGEQFYLEELENQKETLGEYIRNCYQEEFVVKYGLPKEDNLPETSLF